MRYFQKFGPIFRMYIESGLPAFDMRPDVRIVLRNYCSRSLPNPQQDGYCQYIVEILTSNIHTDTNFRQNKLATFRVPITWVGYGKHDTELVMSMFESAAFGQTHTLGLQEYVVDNKHGHLLTINGFFWDGTISHVKDIQER